MQIEVLPSVGSPLIPYLEDKLVIVVDVLRLTSTVLTALANGAQAIIPALTPEEALEKRLHIPGSLLGGERRSERIEGFDFGNSPYEYVPEKVGGKRIIMTTTNGTRAIRTAEAAPHIWMASFLNIESIIHAIQWQFEKENLSGIVIFCAGTEEKFDLADTLCAGMIIDELGLERHVDNDLGIAARSLYKASEGEIENMVKKSFHGRYLINIGYERDINYCCTKNILPIVPTMQNGEIVWLT